MKQRFTNIFYGKSSIGNGFIALMIISLIVLGCTCNQKDGFKFGKNDSNSANTSDANDAPKNDEPKELSRDVKATKSAPSDEDLQRLMKTTMLDFNQAVQDQDFSAFYKRISKVWQKQITPEKLEEVFKPFMVAKFNVDSIRDMEAEITKGLNIKWSRVVKSMEVNGTYPTKPRAAKVQLKYIEEDGLWKLFGINVDTR